VSARRVVVAMVVIVLLAVLATGVLVARRDTGPTSLAGVQEGQSSPTAGPREALGSGSIQHSTATVDAVDVDVSTPILPGGALPSTTPGQAYQVTSSVSYAPPYAAIELGAIPYGDQNAVMSAQTAARGSAASFRKEIADTRASEGQVFARALPATLFGQRVEGEVTQTTEPVAGVPTTRLHAEWVTEAGERVWILRVTVDDLSDSARDTLVEQLAGITLVSTKLGQKTTVDPAAPAPAPFRGTDQTFSLDLPPWWNARDCDAGRNAAHEILATWNGLESCGPNVDLISTIYAPAGVPRWGAQLEWECVELSKRYLWQRYGISDQPADGFNTVDATARVSSKLVRYSPDGVHVPQAGDVVSFGTVSPGHTSVVIAASVDAQGNGTYTTINENVGRQAIIVFDIIHWLPTTTRGGRGTGIPPVNDWLHDPNNTPGLLGPGGLGTPGTGLATSTPAPLPPSVRSTPTAKPAASPTARPSPSASATARPSASPSPKPTP
jgi:hypothetical protein